MSDGRGFWRSRTHDWSRGLDLGHLADIQRTPARFAPGGVLHLVLEVLAYCADEAGAVGLGRVVVTLMPGGSVSVADDGRGTETRVNCLGRVVKKPIMGTKDLRFFDAPESVTLPNGYLRRGMSVVAALSEWLVHTNRRSNGSWTQRYERGIPVTDLIAEIDDGTTGTTVHFRPDPALLRADLPSAHLLSSLAGSFGPQLVVDVEHARF